MTHNVFAVEVIYTDEFGEWFEELGQGDREAVGVVVDLLAEHGVKLGFPYSSALKGATFALRELRPKRGNSPLRVFYAFDPRRDTVLLIGGDKGSDARFYVRLLPRAERLWTQYLAEQAAGKHDEEKKR